MSADNNAAGNDADTLHSATDSSSKRMRLAFGVVGLAGRMNPGRKTFKKLLWKLHCVRSCVPAQQIEP